MRLFLGLTVLLLVHAAVVLGGVYLMLTAFGEELDARLGKEVAGVERRLDRDVRRIERSFERSLDERLPATAP